VSSLRAARLGPIVGHVTHETARIWIRGDDSENAGSASARNRRTLGVVTIRRAGEGHESDEDGTWYFRLHREYDRTGTFTFGRSRILGSDRRSPRLAPETPYDVRVGTLSVDDPDPDSMSIADSDLVHRLPPPRVWTEELLSLPDDLSRAMFTTGPAPESASGDLAFLIGSCRYPGRLWKARHADEIFGPMLEEALGREGRSAARMVLMVGDQIYADMFNRKVPVGRADTFDEFQQRYLAAFGSPNMRRLLRSVPTYMILDDHEIEDNWHQDRVRTAEGRHLFTLAIGAYMSYQWLHGPRNYGQRLFYDLSCAGYPFFVLDTRTQRWMDNEPGNLDDNHLLGRPALSPEEPSQLDLLLNWLAEQQQTRGNVPKFIVTSGVFVPNPVYAREGRAGDPLQRARWKERSDSWPAFPATRRSVLQQVVDERVQNVVFLSGDVHCANVAQLEFGGNDEVSQLRAYSITSSALYWPFPFSDGDPAGFVHDSKAEGQEDTFELDDDVTVDYRAWGFTQEDNFCRVDVDPDGHRLIVSPFGKDGRELSSGGIIGRRGEPLRSELKLAPWRD